MRKNLVIETEEGTKNAKNAIRFYYDLAKKYNLIDKLIDASKVSGAKQLRWSYQNGRISQNQLQGYKETLGAKDDFITGLKKMNQRDRDEAHKILEEKIKGKESAKDTSDDLIERIKKCKTIDEVNKLEKELQMLQHLLSAKKIELQIKNES